MASIYDAPSGPKNLKVLFPSIVWETVVDYWIEVLAGGTILATSPMMKLGCCCGDDDIVVHFLNSLGRFDSMPFSKPHIIHDTKSGLFKKSLNDTFSRQDYGWQRFNVNANDTYEVKNTCINEADLIWATELLDSPFAFLQFDSDQQVDDGLIDDYLPITILDGTFDKQKSDTSVFQSVLTIKFSLSNQFITQRN